MFEVGEYVVCGNNGVCRVHDITTLSMSGVDKKRKYYIMKPVYAGTSTVYVPVDSVQATVRKVLSKEEADALLNSVAEIEILKIPDEKSVEAQYRACMQSGSCREWVRLMKTLYWRKKLRLQGGRKVTALDSRYYKLVQESLCGELAVALESDREEVSRMVAQKLEEKKPEHTR